MHQDNKFVILALSLSVLTLASMSALLSISHGGVLGVATSLPSSFSTGVPNVNVAQPRLAPNINSDPYIPSTGPVKLPIESGISRQVDPPRQAMVTPTIAPKVIASIPCTAVTELSQLYCQQQVVKPIPTITNKNVCHYEGTRMVCTNSQVVSYREMPSREVATSPINNNNSLPAICTHIASLITTYCQTPPTPVPSISISTKCSTDKDCPINNVCYQPPMAPCANGTFCAQVMPTKICRPSSVTIDPQPVQVVETRCKTNTDCGTGRTCYLIGNSTGVTSSGICISSGLKGATAPTSTGTVWKAD